MKKKTWDFSGRGAVLFVLLMVFGLPFAMFGGITACYDAIVYPDEGTLRVRKLADTAYVVEKYVVSSYWQGGFEDVTVRRWVEVQRFKTAAKTRGGCP